MKRKGSKGPSEYGSASSAMPLVEGDCVEPVCGGPTMVVIDDPLARIARIGGAVVRTMWFDKQGHQQTGLFAPDTLRLLRSDPVRI